MLLNLLIAADHVQVPTILFFIATPRILFLCIERQAFYGVPDYHPNASYQPRDFAVSGPLQSSSSQWGPLGRGRWRGPPNLRLDVIKGGAHWALRHGCHPDPGDQSLGST